MLDRSTPPKIVPINHHKISSLKKIQVAEAVHMYVLSGGNQDIIKIEFVFNSGYTKQKKTGIIFFTANMLLEGTEKNDFESLAKLIEKYGAEINVQTGYDYTSITLLCMNSYLNDILNIFEEIVLLTKFSEDRLNQLKIIEKNKILLNEALVDKVAYKEFRKNLYPEHSYGTHLTIDDIDLIQLLDIQECYNKDLFINPNIFVSGLIDDTTIIPIMNTIQKVSSKFIKKSKINDKVLCNKLSGQVYNVNVKETPLQSAICMGKVVVKKDNEDFVDLYIANTILGGYFGSRLMKNIREKNGFTYGIHSSIVTLQKSAFIVIKAEIDEKYIFQTLNEIKNELNILTTKPCEIEELLSLKNYLHGMLLMNTENPIMLMEKIKSAYLYNLDESYYDNLYARIISFDNEKLMNISNSYFKSEQMITVIAK